jgi:hypothetical protein
MPNGEWRESSAVLGCDPMATLAPYLQGLLEGPPALRVECSFL